MLVWERTHECLGKIMLHWSEKLYNLKSFIKAEYLCFSHVAQLVKNLPAMWETWVWFLGWEDPRDKGTATYSSILAWRIPWTVYSLWVTKSQTGLSNFHSLSHRPWNFKHLLAITHLSVKNNNYMHTSCLVHNRLYFTCNSSKNSNNLLR